MRVVLDSNVLISAVLWPFSTPSRAVREAANHQMLRSPAIIQEATELFERPKFDRYAPLNQRMKFLSEFIDASESITPQFTISECRDPKDDKYLELAVCGSADCIVTGDVDLLILHPFRDIPILSPADFLAWLPP